MRSHGPHAVQGGAPAAWRRGCITFCSNTHLQLAGSAGFSTYSSESAALAPVLQPCPGTAQLLARRLRGGSL